MNDLTTNRGMPGLEKISANIATKLRRSAFERKIIRDMCNATVSSIFYCFGDEKKLKQREKEQADADVLFEDIMSSPEKIQKAIDSYVRMSKAQRVAELEAELEYLKKDL